MGGKDGGGGGSNPTTMMRSDGMVQAANVSKQSGTDPSAAPSGAHNHESILSDQNQVQVKVNQNQMSVGANSSNRAASRIAGGQELQSVVTAEVMHPLEHTPGRSQQ